MDLRKVKVDKEALKKLKPKKLDPPKQIEGGISWKTLFREFDF